MRVVAASLSLACLLLALTARAGDDDDPFVKPDAGAPVPDGSACIRAPDRAKGLTMWKNMREQIALYDRTGVAIVRDLVQWKEGAAQIGDAARWLTCDHPAFTTAEQAEASAFEAKASKWSAAILARLPAEEQGRAQIVVPLCEATWGAAQEEKIIARERANPSGVVDLRALHEAGELLQQYREQIAALRPLYRKMRGRDYVKWQDEGACVEAATKPD